VHFKVTPQGEDAECRQSDEAKLYFEFGKRKSGAAVMRGVVWMGGRRRKRGWGRGCS
jgi:hypothetical protein